MAEQSKDKKIPPSQPFPVAEALLSETRILRARTLVEAMPLEMKVCGESSHPKNGDVYSDDIFEHQDKLQLPPAPKGKAWVYQSSSRRWRLQPLVEAVITSVEYEDDGGTNAAPPMLEHWIQPTDNFSGLCLKYGLTATQLRRANFGFSGFNLFLAPNPLKIPNIQRAVPEEMNREKMLQTFLLVFREELTKSEAKCYLELNDWDMNQALQNAEQDLRERDFSTDPSGERARFDTPIEKVMIDEDL